MTGREVSSLKDDMGAAAGSTISIRIAWRVVVVSVVALAIVALLG